MMNFSPELLARRIEEEKKRFILDCDEKYCLLAISPTGTIKREGVASKLTAREIARDFWCCRKYLAVEVFHLSDDGKIMTDYHALRSWTI